MLTTNLAVILRMLTGKIRFLISVLFYNTPVMGNMKTMGFTEHGQAKERIEVITQTFISYANIASQLGMNDYLMKHMRNVVNPELRGFAYEAVAMSLYMLDSFTLSRQTRIRELLRRAPDETPLINIGVGIGAATLMHSCDRVMRQHTHITRPMIVDGYAFWYVLFQKNRVLYKQWVPNKVKASPLLFDAFTAGVGRAAWFVECADCDRIAEIFSAFRSDRHPHLWRGLGVASTYAGGVDRSTLERVRVLSGEHLETVAIGSAIACWGRFKEDNFAPHNELAAAVYWDMSGKALGSMVQEIAEEFGEKCRLADGSEAWTEMLRRIGQLYREKSI